MLASLHLRLLFSINLHSGAAIALVLTNYGRSFFIIVYVWSSRIYEPTWTGIYVYIYMCELYVLVYIWLRKRN